MISDEFWRQALPRMAEGMNPGIIIMSDGNVGIVPDVNDWREWFKASNFPVQVRFVLRPKPAMWVLMERKLQ